MLRKIINIDEEKCNGCGACANACHEGAIAIVNGKAKLIRDDYCDGMGDCLPECPEGAITFVEREADAYNEQAVEENKKKKAQMLLNNKSSGCPGTTAMQINLTSQNVAGCADLQTSGLHNWPVQIKLAPLSAPYYDNAKLLVAADCTAYAYASFHREFMHNKVTLIGCPKLDGIDYSEKLSSIIKNNNINSVTIVRMEVPCCGGLENAAKKAIMQSGKFLPWQVVTISVDGRIIDD